MVDNLSREYGVITKEFLVNQELFQIIEVEDALTYVITYQGSPCRIKSKILNSTRPKFNYKSTSTNDWHNAKMMCDLYNSISDSSDFAICAATTLEQVYPIVTNGKD